MPRRRPLHTCAASSICIAHKACKKLQDVEGPVGSTAKRAIAFSTSFFTPILPHILAILSIIDDQILTIETRVETILPPSTYLFDKIDSLVCGAQTLPQQLDNVDFTKLASIPLLYWALAHLISCLNFLVSILTHLAGSNNTREKEIRVDINCKRDKDDATNNEAHNSRGGESSKGLPKGVVHLSVKRFHSWKSRMKALEEPLYAGDSPMYSSYQSAISSPVFDSSPHAFASMSCTYKEMLERGTKEEDDQSRES